MGCGGSKKETATVSVSAEPKSEFDARLAKGLQRYSKEMEAKSKGGKIVSFNQVILKFRKINNALKTVKAIFEDIGGGQKCILHDDCVRALAELGDGGLSDEKLAAIFHEADIFTHGKLSLKEFTLCICMGYVLGDMKLDNATTFTPADAADAKAESIDRKSSRFFTSENELREAFDVIIGCYLLFDADGTGDLDKGEVLAMMEEKKGPFRTEQPPTSLPRRGGKSSILIMMGKSPLKSLRGHCLGGLSRLRRVMRLMRPRMLRRVAMKRLMRPRMLRRVAMKRLMRPRMPRRAIRLMRSRTPRRSLSCNPRCRETEKVKQQ